jgi:hypothetical protein
MGANEYRQWALKCLVMARRVADPQQKARLIDMATSWSLLAHRHEAPREQTVEQQQQLQSKQSKA